MLVQFARSFCYRQASKAHLSHIIATLDIVLDACVMLGVTTQMRHHLLIMPVKGSQVLKPAGLLDVLQQGAILSYQRVGDHSSGLLRVLVRGTISPLAGLVSVIPMGRSSGIS